MAITVNTYNQLLNLIGAGVIDLTNDTFKAILLDSNHVFDATDTKLSDVNTNEVANGNGYATGGVALTVAAGLVGSPGSPWTFDFDDLDPGWTASGGSIGPFTDLVIYDDTVTSPADALMFSIDLDGEFTAADGAEIKILWHANGLFTITAA